jgi:hypothetical protein
VEIFCLKLDGFCLIYEIYFLERFEMVLLKRVALYYLF